MSTDVLKGKLVLITGCTGGIGLAIARALGKLGCDIAVHHSSDASKPKADSLVAELKGLGVRAAPFKADLSTYEATKKLYDDVVKTLGHPDILLGNHGVSTKHIGPAGNVEDVSFEEFEQTWRTNTGTNYYLCQLCIPCMKEKKWGRIILTSSVAALNGGVIGPHYASSKSAMHGLIHWLSMRYCKEGILTNGIAPALIEETAMMANPSPEIKARIPIGRLGKPDEIASVAVMLLSNGYMTNKIIVADGGWTTGGI